MRRRRLVAAMILIAAPLVLAGGKAIASRPPDAVIEAERIYDGANRAQERRDRDPDDLRAHWTPTWSPTWSPSPPAPIPASQIPVEPSSVDSGTDTPTYPAGNGGCLSADQVASYARGAGFPESAIPTMVSYAARESGYCPGAINSSSGACGLWQLYPCYGGSAWLDPATNAAKAFEKYQASGFSPWGG